MREHYRISQEAFRKVSTVIQTNIAWTHKLITKSSPSYQCHMFSQLRKNSLICDILARQMQLPEMVLDN
jgi:hypothetical protein